jgi:hypothetical protein
MVLNILFGIISIWVVKEIFLCVHAGTMLYAYFNKM